MKGYFNKTELANHLVILCVQTIVQDFIGNENLTVGEKNALKKADKSITEFTNSVIARLGNGYARSLKNKCDASKLHLISKYSPEQPTDMTEKIDDKALQQLISDNYDTNCKVCTCADCKACGIYQIKSYLQAPQTNFADRT